MPTSTTVLLENHPEFIVHNGIPRQKTLHSENQAQTADTFGFKWQKRDTYESKAVQNSFGEWLRERYTLPGQTVADWATGKRILDAGCGSGHSALLLFDQVLNHCDYIGMDISGAVDVAAERFKEHGAKGQFVQSSLMSFPDELGKFDVIFSEGVLHHTDSTEQAVRYLATKLSDDGLLMFYVYKQKSPIREFSDDYIRAKISDMTNDEAWDALMPLTRLGQLLGDLNIDVEIPERIDVLDIPAGKINLQRLFYWHIFKAYYRDDWSLEEMNHVNFDWYRPANCQRHTPEEIKGWMQDLNLDIIQMDVQEAGITTIARKKA